MLRERHTSPFENVVLRFHVKAPIFVFRQWHRHRVWSVSEISARYEALEDEFYIPDIEQIGVQSESNRQGRESLSEDMRDVILPRRKAEVAQYIDRCQDAFHFYHKLLDSGWPRELARMTLPLSTYSRMMGTVDLHNLFQFWRVRSDSHAQYEIRVYADAMQRLVDPAVPVTMNLCRQLELLPPPTTA